MDLSLLSFDLISSVLYYYKVLFFQKKDRLITIRTLYGLQESKIGPKLSLLTLIVGGANDFSNVVDIDNLLVQNSKINSAFLIINE